MSVVTCPVVCVALFEPVNALKLVAHCSLLALWVMGGAQRRILFRVEVVSRVYKGV